VGIDTKHKIIRRREMFGKVLVLALCILFSATQAGFAQVSNDELLDEIRALREQIKRQEQRINELEERLTAEEATPKTIQFADGTVEELNKLVLGGLDIGAGATFIIQGTSNANGTDLSERGEDVTDATYSIDLTVEKQFEDYGMAFIQLETGDGAGVDDELQLFSNVNQDADDSDNSVSLTKAWYEHYFQGLPLTLTFGKIGADDYTDGNEYAEDECTQFLGAMFKHSPTIEFPSNTAGVRLGIAPTDSMDIDLVVSDADDDWEDVADELFFVGQLNFKPRLFDRGGNYRIIGWRSDRDHTRWDDALSVKKTTHGVGISFDQELTDNLGAFLRYGWQDPDVYLNGAAFSLEHAWSAGLQLAGANWNRQNDVLGLAVGQLMPSNEYEDAGTNLEAKDEGHFEAYYNYKVNEHLSLSPDLQIIWNPYGKDAANGDDTIVVGGVRGQVDF